MGRVADCAATVLYVTMIILINHSEIVLKGKNRPFFERKLRENIKYVLKDLGKISIKNLHGRFLLKTETNNWQEVKEKLLRVFGVANFSKVYEQKVNLDKLENSLIKLLEKKGFLSFAVRTKRIDKNISLTSQELTNQLGDFIRKKLGKNVNLDDPDLTIYIDIYKNKVWYYFEKIEGLHGLPIGTSGKVLSFLSGGIDSNVSSYLMARRGCLVNFIHFHALINNKEVLKSKIGKMVQTIKLYTLYSKLYIVPYLPFQMALLNVKTKNELVLFRRFMLKIGEEIARKHKFQTLVTGDNLGQVASQTMENLAVTQQAVNIPVFRPLLTYNKQEIINLSKKIGTYQLSIKPYKDCCSIIEKHPKTKSKLEEVLLEEQQLNMKQLLAQTLKKSLIFSL